jgi:hypothetical protein
MGCFINSTTKYAILKKSHNDNPDRSKHVMDKNKITNVKHLNIG